MNKNTFLILFIAGIIVISGCTQQKELSSKKQEISPADKESCETLGGVWKVWGDTRDSKPGCNLPTTDSGKSCTDSSQCESYCEAPKGSAIDAKVEGKCYGFKIAGCMQEVKNGLAAAAWCY